jgi:pimeloyl-ACP methyl ester carboxylesterase
VRYQTIVVTNDSTPPRMPQPRSGTFHAIVRAGDSVTPYVRMGNGKPVLILRQSGRQSALWSMILTGLSTTNRVMMPEVSPELATLTEWFAQFHDGLGIGPVRIVADERYGLAVLRLALLHGERVARIVILSEADGASELDGTLSSATSETHPVLFMSHDRSADEVLMRTQEFLVMENAVSE